MRSWFINELGSDKPTVVTEDEIRDYYYPYWLDAMANRWGENPDNWPCEATVDNAIDDWVVVNWAWPVDE